ncbi:MAG: tRNA (5-methylaminomethyl-2-thiouridine)(34)-methyltransferase MnmD [Saprospiraceae bacterium]|nr:tRNA (5-methylaminomethyl-2-thiouridine)(34)-methyltransferase MnmD [Saprospiraceae bacterium]
MGERSVIQTNDGSSSVLDSFWNASFHSVHGALTESNHVYINSGLSQFQNSLEPVRIFEFGFGTGLNTFLSFIYGLKHDISIEYTAIDSHILENDLVSLLDYPKHPLLLPFSDFFFLIHQHEWNKPIQLSQGFRLNKIKSDWTAYVPNEPIEYDLVFFDAFGPEVQPELWDFHSLQKVYSMMKQGGIFCTYCAKGSVKRLLKQIGFKLESLPGPPGKREISRAIKL